MSVTQFAVRTSHRTYLAADPATFALGHRIGVPDGSQVLAQWYGEDACVLTRRDGGPLKFIASDSPQPLLPARLVTDADRSRVAFRHVDGPLITALPDGRVMHDREQIADWELFTLEPDGGQRPPISAALDSDSTFEAFCLDAANEAGPIASLLALLPSERRRVVLPKLSARADYGPIFAALRRLLSGGRDRSVWHTRAHLRGGIDAHGWVVGDHTYGAPLIVDGEYGNLEIGRYGSIAAGVTIIVANHAVDRVTTYPFSALAQFWPSAPNDMSDHASAGVVIGHGVWIGQGATILPGARIGDGAIIGAGAVISKIVPPYSVSVGNPARTARLRFGKATIERLLKLRWWDWPDEKVDRFVPLLLSADVEKFLDEAERSLPLD
jgi:acetyltransferase-like isoleucine patch superfamily enzyme